MNCGEESTSQSVPVFRSEVPKGGGICFVYLEAADRRRPLATPGVPRGKKKQKKQPLPAKAVAMPVKAAPKPTQHRTCPQPEHPALWLLGMAGSGVNPEVLAPPAERRPSRIGASPASDLPSTINLSTLPAGRWA